MLFPCTSARSTLATSAVFALLGSAVASDNVWTCNGHKVCANESLTLSANGEATCSSSSQCLNLNGTAGTFTCTDSATCTNIDVRIGFLVPLSAVVTVLGTILPRQGLESYSHSMRPFASLCALIAYTCVFFAFLSMFFVFCFLFCFCVCVTFIDSHCCCQMISSCRRRALSTARTMPTATTSP